ncbi:MAG TPA: Ig-like domain-containing protein [Ohtaekwangia sp.]|nr:Ig-like domain-containing protein [Ohtaekwangia sp.]
MLFLLFACSEEDEQPADTTAPTVHFEQESTSYFKGVTEFAFAATDDAQLAGIRVFIDGAEVASHDFTSSSEVFTFSFDTKNLSDGTHRLKLVLTDASQNSFEREFDIVVRNTLFRLHIPAGYLTGEFWIFLSDDAGNVLGVQEGSNGAELVFPMPESFTQETVNLTLFQNWQNSSSNPTTFRGFTTTTRIKPGTYYYGEPHEFVPQAKIGEAVVQLTDWPSAYKLIPSGPGLFNYLVDIVPGGKREIKIGLAEDPADIFLLTTDGQGHYKYLMVEGLTQAGNKTFSFEDFLDMDLTVIPVEAGMDVSCSQWGYLADDSRRSYSLNPFLNDQGAINVISAPGVFKHYSAYIRINEDNVYYVLDSRNTLPPVAFQRSTANIVTSSFSDGVIDLTLEGESDIIIVQNGGVEDVGGSTFVDDWYIMLPHADHITFTRPQVPEEILSRYFLSGLKLHDVSMVHFHDLSWVSTYDDYLNDAYRTAPFTQDVHVQHEDIVSKTILFESTGGRRRKTGSHPSLHNVVFPWERNSSRRSAGE